MQQPWICPLLVAEPTPRQAVSRHKHKREAGRAALQIADHNMRVTLEAIRREGPLTRLELGQRSGLTAPGITNILRRLHRDGLITGRKRQENGGRPSAREFSINPDGVFAIGVRVGAGRGNAVLVDLNGRQRNAVSFKTKAGLPAAIAALPEVLVTSVPDDVRIAGMGISSDTGANLDADALRAALGPMPVYFERDCVAAVLAERTLGIGGAEGGLFYIIVDERVRAGLLLRGAPFSGVHGRAGEIGTMRAGVDQLPLNQVVALGALRARLSAAECAILASGADLPITPAVQGWIRDAAGLLLDAIVTTAGFLAPGAIVIGGDLPRNLIDALITRMSVERGDPTVRPIASPWISPMRAASFSGAGIALGAALLPFFDQLLPSPYVPTV